MKLNRTTIGFVAFLFLPPNTQSYADLVFRIEPSTFTDGWTFDGGTITASGEGILDSIGAEILITDWKLPITDRVGQFTLTPANSRMVYTGSAASGSSLRITSNDMTFPIVSSGSFHRLRFEQWIATDKSDHYGMALHSANHALEFLGTPNHVFLTTPLTLASGHGANEFGTSHVRSVARSGHNVPRTIATIAVPEPSSILFGVLSAKLFCLTSWFHRMRNSCDR